MPASAAFISENALLTPACSLTPLEVGTIRFPCRSKSVRAINCFVQTVRRQVSKHGIRVGSVSPGPVISALLADWPPEKLKEARESGSLLEASDVANVITFMLTRPRGMTIRDVIMLPTNFDL
jgi:ribitol 2-dehydrogenase